MNDRQTLFELHFGKYNNLILHALDFLFRY
jgi:hypothetical protein